MTSIEVRCRLRDYVLEEVNKKRSCFEGTVVDALESFYGLDTDDSPFRKRRRLESVSSHDSNFFSKTTARIPIARVTLKLALSSDTQMTHGMASGTPNALDDIKEIGLVGISTISEDPPVRRRRFGTPSLIPTAVRFAIQDRESSKKSAALVFETIEGVDQAAYDVLATVVRLERRNRNNNTDKGVAHPQCRLIRSVHHSGNSFALECTILWSDGESAFGQRAFRGTEWDILKQIYKEPGGNISEKWSWTAQDFYDSVYSPPTDLPPPEGLDMKIMKTELYPFQKRAVAWMLGRERQSQVVDDFSYKKSKDALNGDCFFSHLQGVVSSTANPSNISEPKGGILAEEMGLGKTCELIALLCTNRRPPELGAPAGLAVSRATLIVTPQTILQQWLDELVKHAPDLSVLHYTGMASVSRSKDDEQRVLRDLATKDVVICSYSTLAKELHYAVDPPERNLRRRASRHERPRSPLVRVHWWRVCLDEAQMVESGVSAAAQVASFLPRENAWAVSGTPLRKNVEDLFGLLVFLKYRPFCDSSIIWRRLISEHRTVFQQIFGRIALRHSKDKVRNELRLPPQRRVVITTPFTTIEEQNYNALFEEMCQDVECATDGSPLNDQWELRLVAEKMRSWLVRLRQTCLHPQVGGRNKRALGRGNAPLRTVAEVLEVMIDQNETAIRTDSRLAITNLVLQGHIIGNVKDDKMCAVKAVDIYKTALQQAEEVVSECRAELSRLTGTAEITGVVDHVDHSVEDEQGKTPEQAARAKSSLALHSALQTQHMCAFFVGTAYFQIKTNEAITVLDSDRFKEAEKLEESYYGLAKLIRREMLRETMSKAETLMKKIETSDFTRIKESSLHLTRGRGGIESARIETKAEGLADTLDAQAQLIHEWRSKLVGLLLKPLVDEDEGIETTGDEYEESTKQQDTLYAYSDALRAIVADRNTCITGQSAPLVDYEMKVLLRDARDKKGHAPELMVDLLTRYRRLKQNPDEIISIRSMTHEARSLETSLEWQDGSSMRAGAELAIVQKQLRYLSTIAEDETKVQSKLEKELDLFRSTLNQRLEFYRQLQYISDTVAPYKVDSDASLDTSALKSAKEAQEAKDRSLAQLKTKHTFLLHLREESNDSSEPERICVICQCPFDRGVLTVCGHQYCKECIQHWWKQHRTCPICKRVLHAADFHDITYKPRELRAQEEGQSNSESSSPGRSGLTNAQSSTIYMDISRDTLAQINTIDLKGSYGTKIDTLARHVLWLRVHDAGAKSIVFSQYREFLDVLGTAFKQFGIGFSRMGKAGAIDRFKQDASVEVFLLDAKTDSSGLNLVNAQHVFLAEPLINTAIELQAIARVHRIGQQRSTTVYMYLIGDTVEEAIYDISVTRRLAHMQRAGTGSGKSRSATPMLVEAAFDAANSLEMQQAPLSKLLVQGSSGGEMVAQDDLWACLFSKANSTKGKPSDRLQAEVGRHLRAEAAVDRMDV